MDEVPAGLNERFAAGYSTTGRPSVPPERLLKALLLMALYSVRSERQLVERIDTEILFRWFLDMAPDDPAFDATVFTHNRPRLDEHGLTGAFFDAVLKRTAEAGLKRPKTLVADRGYASGPWRLELQKRGVEPHAAMLDTTRDMSRARPHQRERVEARQRMRERIATPASRASQRCRKKVEEVFGWIKTVAGFRRSRHVGRAKIAQQMELAAACNVVRMRKLLPT